MKTIQLHPVSLLVGLAGGVIGLLLMSQSAVSTLPTGRVEVGPHPRDMVQIAEGQPYTVPPGKILVVTAVGYIAPGPGTATLKVNGVTALTMHDGSNLGMRDVPRCLSVQWGNVVEVEDGVAPYVYSRAWGYLADR